MGNIPLQGGASAVDEIDKNLKKVLLPLETRENISKFRIKILAMFKLSFPVIISLQHYIQLYLHLSLGFFYSFQTQPSANIQSFVSH